jgi:hypothetical protein
MSALGGSDFAIASENVEIDEEDDWETNDPPIFYSEAMTVSDASTSSNPTENNNADWDTERAHPDSLIIEKKVMKEITPTEEKDSIILILVDLTALSNGKIHNKFDKYSVNDQDAKKAMCHEITSNYDSYANNSELIMNQTVRHCSEIVWKDALESLRNQHKGHYWFPIFPPTPTNKIDLAKRES